MQMRTAVRRVKWVLLVMILGVPLLANMPVVQRVQAASPPVTFTQSGDITIPTTTAPSRAVPYANSSGRVASVMDAGRVGETTLAPGATTPTQSPSRFELAMRTRGAHSFVRRTPTGFPLWTRRVSSSPSRRSSRTIASNAAQDRAAHPVPP